MAPGLLLLSSALLGAFGPVSATPALTPLQDAWRLDTVLPAVPGKNRVRWWEFDWHYVEFKPAANGAPVRLYFYVGERGVAELAKPAIEQAYKDLVPRFGYTPGQTIPFLLYNSHFEFQSTTAFFISEGVLGVTSPEDLRMALPYWGEHQRFEHVMRHELAHQFTIQKLDFLGRQQACNPVAVMPLWFIEGIAEWASLPALTPEVHALLADKLVAQRDPGDQLTDFFASGPLDFDRVYLLGHAQVRFLEETFGDGTLRRVLEASPELCGAGLSLAPAATISVAPFAQLLARITGSSPEDLRRRFRNWAEDKVSSTRSSRQPMSSLEVLEDRVDSFSISPDGRVVLLRTFDPDTGVTRLFLRDLESGRRHLVAADQALGLFSLHPLDRRITALGKDRLAYIGRSGPGDAVFVRSWRRNARGSIELGRAVRHPLESFDEIIEGGYPAFDAANGALLFAGLSRASGLLDVYRIEDPLDGHAPITKLTETPYAEQDPLPLTDGTLFVSDATPDGRFAVMRLQDGKPVLVAGLAAGDVSALTPAGDDFLFVSGASGSYQVYRLSGSALRQRQSDAAPRLEPSARLDLAPGPGVVIGAAAPGGSSAPGTSTSPGSSTGPGGGIAPGGIGPGSGIVPGGGIGPGGVSPGEPTPGGEEDDFGAPDGGTATGGEAAVDGGAAAFDGGAGPAAGNAIDGGTPPEETFTKPDTRLEEDGPLERVPPPGSLVRLTEVPTSITQAALDARGDLIAIARVDDELRLVRVKREALLAEPVETERLRVVAPARILARSELGPETQYNALSPKNYDLAGIAAAFGSGPLIIGDLAFTDLFRSRIVGTSVRVYGDFGQTDASAYYVDQSGRWTLGGALFLETAEQLDEETPPVLLESYLLQRYGARLLVAYPFGHYTRIEGDFSLQALRLFGFTAPLSRTAREAAGTHPAAELGARLVFDTTRLSVVGPVGGFSLVLGAAGTAPLGLDGFVQTGMDLQAAQTLIRGYERFSLRQRIAFGTNFGGVVSEQYYLPAAYNLRAIREGSIELIGRHFYTGQFELHFPLAPVLAEAIYLQGVAGADLGAAFFELDQGWRQRRVAAVLGVNFGLGPIILRLHFARPLDVGPLPVSTRWLTHLSLVSPLGALF